MDREAVMSRLIQIVDREVPPRAREAMDRMARALGLVEPDATWFDRYLELVRAEVAGFYDDHARTLYILGDTPAMMQGPVIAHELFHAIQDQRWGLDSLFEPVEWLTDPTMAAQALVEGDALAVMTAWTLGDASVVTGDSMLRDTLAASVRAAEDGNTSGAPTTMWTQLVFPYVAGLDFIFALVQPDNWSAVDAAYLDPPLSTEQVLHPERYIDRDHPTWLAFDIGLAVAEPRGAERYVADVFGERMIAAVCEDLLADVVAPASCTRAADGWDGDRLEAWSFHADPKRDLVVWTSVWDSVDEAQGFAVVFAGLGVPWLGVATESVGEGRHGQAWEARSDDGILWVERWGDTALVVLDRGGAASVADRAATVGAAVDGVWSTLSRSRYPEF